MIAPLDDYRSKRSTQVARTGLLRRAWRLGGSNWRLLGEALVLLAAASAAIRLFPFRRTAALMSRSRLAIRESAGDRLINQCRWAVNAWADRVPWRAVCFQRGLALQLMLRRRGIPALLHYGVMQDGERGLQAHVWVSVNGRAVQGGEEAAGFACLATFPGEPAA
jgi:hypothetical protein